MCVYAQYGRVIRAAGESDLPLENIMIRVLTLALLLSIPAFCQTMPACNASAPISISASGNTQIIAPVAPASIRICHLSLSPLAATSITLKYGTGTACATGTTSLSGAYQTLIAGAIVALNFGKDAGPVVPPGNAFCIASSASTTVGGLVTYSTY